MKGVSPAAAGLLLLAGAVAMLGLSGVSGPEEAAQRVLSWSAGQIGLAIVREQSPEPSQSQKESPEPEPSPDPVPVPVTTVEEAWDEEARLTEPPSEPVELPIDATLSLELENDTDFDISLPELPGLPAGLDVQAEAPVIPIVHTHTTECYADSDEPGVYRSTAEDSGVMAVGDRMAETLEERGYRVRHDKTFCDYPEYDGAYDRSRAVIGADLEEEPSICLVLDVHRDAVENPDGTHMAMAAEADGEETARMMLVVGTDGGGLEHPDWRQNLSLAAVIQARMNMDYPGLMRPVNLRNQRFNQDLGPMALLVEVGASGNSQAEAERAAVIFARELADTLDLYSSNNP